MKITEEKHNHKLTNLLKVFIFSILMLLPFINVGVRCGYVMLNKNAYESYTQNTYKVVQPVYYETNEINSIDDIIFGNIYRVSNITTYVGANITIQSEYYNLIDFSYESGQNEGTSTGNIYFYGTNSNTQTALRIYYEEDGNTYFRNYLGFTIDIVINSGNNLNNLIDYLSATPNKYIKEYVEVTQEGTLDNVFEYSLNKLEEEQYLTWTQNTAVYQGVESMTTGLGITQTVIPMLIVYWFMLTIIYVIIDIVLAIFTKITHMIGNKTA